jgi:hypothetical protein
MAERLTPQELADRLASAQPRLAEIIQRKAIVLSLMLESDAKGNATESMNHPTGNLRRSIIGAAVDTPRGLAVQLRAGGRHNGEDVVYARLQELGGKITPKRKKWLAIPDKTVKTPAGAAQYPSPRNYPGKLWFHVIEENRRAVLLERVGGKNVGRWWLRKETNIKPKLYLKRAVDKNAPRVPTLLADALRVSLSPSLQGGE